MNTIYIIVSRKLQKKLISRCCLLPFLLKNYLRYLALLISSKFSFLSIQKGVDYFNNGTFRLHLFHSETVIAMVIWTMTRRWRQPYLTWWIWTSILNKLQWAYHRRKCSKFGCHSKHLLIRSHFRPSDFGVITRTFMHSKSNLTILNYGLGKEDSCLFYVFTILC